MWTAVTLNSYQQALILANTHNTSTHHKAEVTQQCISWYRNPKLYTTPVSLLPLSLQEGLQ